MKQIQYREIRYPPRRWDAVARKMVFEEVRPEKMVVTMGKHKGKIVEFCSCTSPKLTVREIGVEDAPKLDIHYTELEMADENGNPIYRDIVDMTGRIITAGKFIVYSVPAGNSSHALEIGQIEEITKTGGLQLKRVIRNGHKLGSDSVRVVNDPDRVLVLPVETPTLMSWVLQEFNDLKD